MSEKLYCTVVVILKEEWGIGSRKERGRNQRGDGGMKWRGGVKKKGCASGLV